jgi:hypothetical protein
MEKYLRYWEYKMKSKKVICNRYGVSDIVIEKKYEHLIPKYLEIKDEEGNVLESLQIYFIEEEELEEEEI